MGLVVPGVDLVVVVVIPCCKGLPSTACFNDDGDRLADILDIFMESVALILSCSTLSGMMVNFCNILFKAFVFASQISRNC